jgi:tetratricopeptide (TPR) repeat protein
LDALGAVLHNEGKFAEAEPVYTELLAVRRKVYGNEDPRVLDAFSKLNDVFDVLHRDKEAQRVFDEMMAASGADGPRTGHLWQNRAEYLARHAQWKEAVDAAAHALAILPGDHVSYHIQAPLLVETGNRNAYGELCERISAHFRGATDVYAADRMAKDSLILRRPGADLNVAVELADTAVTVGAGSPAFDFFECSKALAEYRQGHWAQAIDWAQRVATNSHPYPQAEACAIMAMAQAQSQHAEQARSALAQCAKIVENKMPKIDSGDLGSDWRDWIIAHALLSEAQSLVQGPPSSTVAGE